jgi:hypothetical protein
MARICQLETLLTVVLYDHPTLFGVQNGLDDDPKADPSFELKQPTFKSCTTVVSCVMSGIALNFKGICLEAYCWLFNSRDYWPFLLKPGMMACLA